MPDNTEDLLARLNKLDFSLDYMEQLEKIAEELQESENPYRAVEPVLRFIESNPNQDLGAPGPLVHFVEKFHRHGYEPLLIESLNRKPTELTVWMLNRLINGSKGSEKDSYLSLMERIASDKQLPANVRRTAERFIDHQKRLD